GPGVGGKTGLLWNLILGELEGGDSARGAGFLTACGRAGFDAELSDKIQTELWLKFIILATNSAITAATRQPLGRLREDSEIMALFAAATDEVVAVARARGVPLPENAADRNKMFVANAPAAMMASMAHDLIRGSRIELPWLSGKVVSLGRELGVPTPVHATLYAVLKPYAMGQPG